MNLSYRPAALADQAEFPHHIFLLKSAIHLRSRVRYFAPGSFV